MVTENSSKQTPKTNKTPLNQPQNSSENRGNNMSLISPRFKSVAAMAGWDEEALLLASLVVEDTPERILKEKRNSDLNHKSPLSNSNNNCTSRRKRRRSRVVSIPVLNLEEDDHHQSSNTNQKEIEKGKIDLPKKIEDEPKEEKEKEESANCSSSSTLACMDRLKDELSCAICLEICYEPSTTTCGHSFCKNCLKSAADKCGKRCPKCRQLISNGRSCTINTVLWNTIQLLFPQEVEARKAAAAAATLSTSSSKAAEERRKGLGARMLNASNHSNNNDSNNLNVSRRTRVSRRLEEVSVSRRRGVPDQDEDAALALRLQREEFMEIYRSDSSLARDNLRAMARRAMNVPRNRGNT